MIRPAPNVVSSLIFSGSRSGVVSSAPAHMRFARVGDVDRCERDVQVLRVDENEHQERHEMTQTFKSTKTVSRARLVPLSEGMQPQLMPWDTNAHHPYGKSPVLVSAARYKSKVAMTRKIMNNVIQAAHVLRAVET